MKAPLNFPVSDIIAAIGVIMASVEVFDHAQRATKDHKQLSDKFTEVTAISLATTRVDATSRLSSKGVARQRRVATVTGPCTPLKAQM